MTVWLVNPFYDTPMEGFRPQRNWLLARAFIRAGFDVVYWTSDFSHATKRKRVFHNPNIDPIAIRLIPSIPYPRNICIRRVVSHHFLAKRWTAMAMAETSRPDIIIASTPPLALCNAARIFAKKINAIFVADIHDAWPETFERLLPPFVFTLLGWRSTAKRIYCQANAVTSVASRYLDLARSYGCNAPMNVFWHCIEMPTVVPPLLNSPSSQALRLAYIGNMSLSYDLATAIKAVAAMPSVTLDLAGDGPDRTKLEFLANKLKASNVTFHGYLDSDSLATLLRQCDVGLIPMFPDSCVGVPCKIADYAAAGLRIIESLGGETASIVDRHRVGVHYIPGNVTSLKEAISSVERIPAGDFKAFASDFDATTSMDRYVEWLTRNLCNNKKNAR